MGDISTNTHPESDAGRKRRRSESPNNGVERRSKASLDDDLPTQDELPQPYNAKELQPAKRRAVSPSDQGRKQKRPGRRALLSQEDRDNIRRRQIEREREQAATEAAAAERQRLRGINDVVTQHYNSVPERGRDWRKTDSKIKGLRSFNNWVKSCLIQKFSPDEDMAESRSNILVLDIGCGKGGDLVLGA